MQRPGDSRRFVAGAVLLVLALGAAAQSTQAQAPAPAPASGAAAQDPRDPEIPADYVIGPEDVLSIVFWRDQDMTADVVVRPDGKITLPLINDIHAAGLKPEELRARVTEAASKLIESPNVMVRVREIKSRKVFITGMVGNSGAYPLVGPTFAAQLIATAGGLLEYAKDKEIRIVRNENGRQVAYRFNYNDFKRGRNLQQNIELKPGDTVIVP
jgi:polysaccharide export outer membrane protein